MFKFLNVVRLNETYVIEVEVNVSLDMLTGCLISLTESCKETLNINLDDEIVQEQDYGEYKSKYQLAQTKLMKFESIGNAFSFIFIHLWITIKIRTWVIRFYTPYGLQ